LLAWGKDIHLLQCIQIGFEAHPAYEMGNGTISPGVKCLTTHPHLAQRLRMCVAIPPLPNGGGGGGGG